MLSLLLVLFHNREDNMEEHEERSSKLWYSLPNFSMAMSIRVVGLDAPCKPRTWSTSSCSFHKLPKKDRIDFKCERRLQETMFFAMKILRVWQVKLQEVMVYDQNLGTMNHRDKRDRKPWSWSITNLGISCQRKPVVSAESIHSPLHLFFLGHCTSHHHLGMGQNCLRMNGMDWPFLVVKLCSCWQQLPIFICCWNSMKFSYSLLKTSQWWFVCGIPSDACCSIIPFASMFWVYLLRLVVWELHNLTHP